MKRVAVDERLCPQNHPCPSIKVCAYGALKQSGYRAPVAEDGLCTGCGKCVRFCPRGALQLKEI